MKERQKHIVLFVFFICVVVVLLGRMVSVWMLNYLKNLDNQIAQQQVVLSEATGVIKDNEEYINKWQEIRGFQDEPVEDRQTQFSAYLEGLEEQREFVFSQVTPSERPMEGNAKFREFSYQLTFWANLEDLVEFLAQLDQSERLVRIDNLEISHRKVVYRDRYTAFLPGARDLLVKVTATIPAAAAEVEGALAP